MKLKYMFINNSVKLAKHIFDVTDITSEALDLPNVEQFDLWTSPSIFKHGLTNLILKCKPPINPSQYMPIILSSIICRLFHKVVVRRLETKNPLNIRKKSFMRRELNINLAYLPL